MEPVVSQIVNDNIEIHKLKDRFLIRWNRLRSRLIQVLKNLMAKKVIRKLMWLILFVISPFILLYLVFLLQDNVLAIVPAIKHEHVGEENNSLDQLKKKTLNNIVFSQQKLNRKTPGSTYLVINSSTNEFKLYSGVKEVRKGICSTGSYTLLESTDNQKWLFKTPRGVLRILGKTENPVWIKPDWAFIEEGLPVPGKGDDSRYEYGTLGDYALSLGDGYLIHGTLYKRFLGMPVTHGCIRMNDEDLEEIFKTLKLGSKVFIY